MGKVVVGVSRWGTCIKSPGSCSLHLLEPGVGREEAWIVRVMMFVKGDPEPGAVPSAELLEEMGRFNEELTKAGVLLELGGLHPSVEGVRIRFSGGKPDVIQGPFTETKDIVAGYWILQVKSMEEAVEWAKRVPVATVAEYQGEAEVEVRQIFELEEFGTSEAIERART